MKRQPVIRKFLSSLCHNDVAIFSNNLCREAFEYDRKGNFYMDGIDSMAAPFGLGLSMGTDKRIFIFVSDSEFLREFGIAPQIAASKCKNIFYVVLHSGRYQSSGGQFNIFREIRAPKGLLFNLGFLVHDYTHYLKERNSEKIISKLLERLKGPLAILISVDYGINKNLDEISYSKKELKERLIDFVANKDLGTSLYNTTSLAIVKNNYNT